MCENRANKERVEQCASRNGLLSSCRTSHDTRYAAFNKGSRSSFLVILPSFLSPPLFSALLYFLLFSVGAEISYGSSLRFTARGAETIGEVAELRDGSIWTHRLFLLFAFS